MQFIFTYRTYLLIHGFPTILKKGTIFKSKRKRQQSTAQKQKKSFTEDIFVLQLKQTNKTTNKLNKGQGGLISDNNKSLKLLLCWPHFINLRRDDAASSTL